MTESIKRDEAIRLADGRMMTLRRSKDERLHRIAEEAPR